MMGIWTKTSKEPVVKSFLFEMFKVGYRSTLSGKEGRFDVLETKDWVNVVPITPDGKVVLVRQFRFGVAAETLEFPAGAVEPGEDPIEAAKRELREETGSSGTSIVATGRCAPNPAFLNNHCHHFVALGVEFKQPPALDGLEELTHELHPIETVDAMISDGRIDHALSVAAWHYFRRSERHRA